MSHLITFFRVSALKDLGWENKRKKKIENAYLSVLRRSPTKPVLRGYLNEPAVFVIGLRRCWKVSFLVSLSSRKWKNSRSYGFSINFPVYCLPVKTKLAFYAELKVICMKPITPMPHAGGLHPAKEAPEQLSLILPIQRQCFPKTSRLWFSEVRWNYP